MIGFVLSELRERRWRALALALGILSASVSFILLTASARTSAIQVRGTLTKNFRPAYDILVRPAGSYTSLEREQGLVRDNYLSGIYGGITRGQYATIKKIPGVSVAAPIANIGTVFVPGRVSIPFSRFIAGARDGLLALRFSWVADRGLSHYPGGVVYVYLTHRRFFLYPSSSRFGATAVTEPGVARPLPICDGFASAPTAIAPFAPANSTYFVCFSTNRAASQRALDRRFPPGTNAAKARVVFNFSFPVSLAAIDPVEETKLVGLDKAIVSGHYLSATDSAGRRGQRFVVPVIASRRSVVDEQLRAVVERLRIPATANVPALLAAGACAVAVLPCPADQTLKGPPRARNETAYRFVTSLDAGSRLETRTFSASAAYAGASGGGGTYWTSGPTRYKRLGRETLAPIPVTNSDETWIDEFNGQSGYYDQPTDNLDVQFRRLTEHSGSNLFVDGALAAPELRTVGRFDTSKLPGFSQLSAVPLETYYPPRLEAADARTRTLLHGRALEPSQNVGSYIAQPPLFLTTLGNLHAFLDASRFDNLSPLQERAPISVIRVRVAGAIGLDALSRERVKTVAQLIHDRTGLAVDVTAGSSPTPITIDLPKGRFGRHALELQEGWVEKGVAVRYLRALDRKDLALFALVLLVCAFFLANGTFASVRARRSEIGVLRTLGWPSAAIFTVVLGELIAVGLIAGLLGVAIAVALVNGLSLSLSLSHTLLVLPLAVALAALAGTAPAYAATRGEPLDAVRPPVAMRRRGRARSIIGLALTNLLRLPLRSALGAASLAVGVAALTLLLGIERAFRGTLVTTLLGNAISLQVRRSDLVAAGLTIALAAVAVGDILYLNVRERAGEIAALQTTGWANRHLLTLILAEGVVLSALGSASGAAIGVALGGIALGVSLLPLIVAAAIATAIGVAAATLGATYPALATLAAPPALALAE